MAMNSRLGRHTRGWLAFALVCVVLSGCSKPQPPVSEAKSGGLVRGDATDLPIYDKSAGMQVTDINKFPADVQHLWKQIDPTPHIEVYHEAQGHYPADYAEFKAGILEPKKLKFPAHLPGGMLLQYDEANHKVVIVKEGRRSN